jgi:hypothetical protein
LEVNKTSLFDFGIEINHVDKNFLVGPFAHASVCHTFMGHFSHIAVVGLAFISALGIIKVKQISHYGGLINHRRQ